MRMMLFVGSIVAVALFFSGSLPYTLVYDTESLEGIEHTGDEPIAADVVKCDIDDTRGLAVGDALNTTFRATLQNNTNRFVAVSAIGEVFDPKGRSMGMNSQLIVLGPNSTEGTHFRSNTPFTGNGSYTCEMRYTVGRFKS